MHSYTDFQNSQVGWLFVLGLAAVYDSISIYIRSSPREREKELVGWLVGLGFTAL